ncbi:unnamed protein product [Rotaria sp. Silwood1]|nr:unnamed protein product [Rotaria sp. Silwood1]
MIEPHRFTSIMTCLTHIARQIVQQTSAYSQGQIYVLPLLMSVLPGIDLNDLEKTSVTLEFLDTILMLITCVDCSSAVNIRNDLTEKIREKVIDFVSGVCLSSRARDIASGLVQALVKGNPVETLKYLMPRTCESIENILNHSESTILLTDYKGDIELTWYLILFAELVHARGDALMIYKPMIMSVFRQCIHFINKNSYETIAHAVEHLLESLTHVYPIDYRLTVENIDEPFVDFLPIRAWGQYVDFDKLQVQFHIPNDDEIDFACEFVNTFMYPELTLLNEKGLKISNDERLRSLTIIQSIAVGCFRMIPRIESEQIQNLIPSVVPYESKYQIQFPIYSQELIIVDRIVELFNTQDEVDHDQIKGCLYILLGDDSFFLPTKYSWTMKEKLWPSIARMAHANKISTQNLIDDIHEKICEETWGQQKITISFLCLLLQKFVPISSSCLETFVEFLVHDNIELRRYATIGITAFCRLQKPPRLYVEKSLEEILHKMDKPLPAMMNDEYCPGDRDDNLWVTIDDYKPPKTQIEWEQTCFLDKSFHGYYTWPKMIKYAVNKQERYTLNNIPDNVTILYDRFIDKNFVERVIQFMILDEDEDGSEINFDKTQFVMFKVNDITAI